MQLYDAVPSVQNRRIIVEGIDASNTGFGEGGGWRAESGERRAENRREETTERRVTEKPSARPSASPFGKLEIQNTSWLGDRCVGAGVRNTRVDVVELVGGGDGVRSGVAVGLVVHKKME